jgi:hypothetical protein
LLAAIARGDKSLIPEGGVMFIDHRVITGENVKDFREELRKLKGQQE